MMRVSEGLCFLIWCTSYWESLIYLGFCLLDLQSRNPVSNPFLHLPSIWPAHICCVGSVSVLKPQDRCFFPSAGAVVSSEFCYSDFLLYLSLEGTPGLDLPSSVERQIDLYISVHLLSSAKDVQRSSDQRKIGRRPKIVAIAGHFISFEAHWTPGAVAHYSLHSRWWEAADALMFCYYCT